MDAILHKFGNKAGKLLARLCKGPYRPMHITSLQDTAGNIKSSQQDINKAMLQYYSSLYANDPKDIIAIKSFLDRQSLPTVSPSQFEALSAPISVPEISNVIRNLAPFKAPGPDGFTGEFYKTLQTITEPTLLTIYNGIWSGGPYLPIGNQANIKLFSQKRKKKQELGSY